MTATTAQLLVIGAGPCGLSAALAARALGINVLLLEAEPEDRERPGSRALYVHRENLERLERISPGLGVAIGSFGIRWRAASTFYGGREVYRQEYPDFTGDGLPVYASLRQIDTERFLLDACKSADVGFVWSAAVSRVNSTADGVTVECADGRSFSAHYVIGADGAQSGVRRALGIAMDGPRSTDYRVAVDLADDDSGAAPPERIMHYRHPAMSGQNLLIVPFTGGIQVDVQCASPPMSERLADPSAVREWLPKVVDPGYLDRILWISRYPCLQRVAESFIDEHRRVLLAGEAAHLFVPLGARGMNSGIADAYAAAAAVGLALSAANPRRRAAAIEEYQSLRRQAAERNRSSVDSALRHLRAASGVQRAQQAAAARLARLAPSLGAWLDTAPYGPRGPVTAELGRY
ncbi:FAD-dependent monooxygenase [Actinocrinis puniceicyclus]|uniref:FAD-dependent monooxygenase n=1 Tax=Actinocrinis puniceicyclus TaxID=977794 RepID=A0A8J8B9Z6_9ACTN|nr:FAD-dependent monooxygenase [Actinocrinis puniceicyclus]MBS2962377.1 FAD-dependent monooxygenase [Actinocrinis puniceicyclus]